MPPPPLVASLDHDVAKIYADAQNNLTTVRLSNQRFNVPVSDAAFRYREPARRGPRG